PTPTEIAQGQGSICTLSEIASVSVPNRRLNRSANNINTSPVAANLSCTTVIDEEQILKLLDDVPNVDKAPSFGKE
ncbi:MAG TPA: hypothetical protein V6C63_07450, partial [Allocoleopsis sp.]